MSILFECVIPGRVGIKKNGKRFFRNRIILPSEKYVAWEKSAEAHVIKANQRYKLPITEPCGILLEFHFKNGQAEPDTTNCTEGPQDLLQKMGVVTNDKLFKVVFANKEIGLEPKTVITIFSLQRSMAALQHLKNLDGKQLALF